ncbi:MAG: homoserine O-succinyltransferase [Pseudomonadales bacterium]|jgi:homoserine O-succinyltransferase|tara:strand:- start:44445 stop:45395 length:951 start_codon:yes stop_codon:yes gene_type:complete
MPIRIADNLPAINALRHENIFCISSSEADHQDIRPLRVLLLNLMPKKIETEVHLMRMLANSPLQMDVELMRINDRPSKNTPIEHMETFYKSFEQVKDQKYDGMIVTGAPLGQTPFEDVTFWEDMKTILDWTQTNVTSVMFLCWGVQAAMYHLYGVEKHVLPKKISGVYPHKLVKPLSPIVRGFDDIFDAPHSRYAEVRTQDVEAQPELEVISVSDTAGAYIFARKDGRQLFVTGHSEYEPLCLKDEYDRDIESGVAAAVPENYFPDDDPTKSPIVTWKSHGNLLFANWLNYYVYQLTPFNTEKIGSELDEIGIALT